MDLDADIFLNFVPIIITATLTLITCVTVFFKLKNRWPVKVNCWFCNGYTKICRNSMDWWLCKHCEQYNGFSRDGDYKYQIPEQHKVFNGHEKNSSYCQQKDVSSSSNLCKKCNKNEELKLFKLRELESSMDVSDEQLVQFERNFDKKHPLCSKCENNVQNVLFKQNQWLTEYKMLLFKQKSVKRLIKNQKFIVKVLHLILSILASVNIYFSEVWYFPLCGVILQLATSLASIKDKQRLNIFPIFGWICLLSIKTFSIAEISEKLNINVEKNWLIVNDNSYNYFVFTLATAICLANLKVQFFKTNSNGSFTMKKLDTSRSFTSLSQTPCPVSPEFSMNSINNRDSSRSLCSPVNITDTLMAPLAIETPIPLKLTNSTDRHFGKSKNSPSSISSRISGFESESSIFPKNYSSKASLFTPDSKAVSRSCVSKPIVNPFENEFMFSKNLNTQNSLSDSLTSLNSLSLGSHKKAPSNSPKVFETKVYGTNSSQLFSNRYSQKRSILAPSKLQSMTQTSWVAGGYWQSGYDLPSETMTLSRSSSQSSGFGSSSSNIGPSQEPSVLEFDQCSMVSDQCSFARPDSRLSSRSGASTIGLRRRVDSSSRCSLANDLSHESESLKCYSNSNNNTSHCSGHANPVWVPALLCGSLVLNMLVLCTVLLR